MEADRRMYEEIALSVMQWAVDSLAADSQAPMPSKMPRKLAAWLPGLSRDDLITLACSDRMAVSAHIRSHKLIPGVRSVRQLDRVEWSLESGFPPDQGSGGFLIALAATDTVPQPAAPAVH